MKHEGYFVDINEYDMDTGNFDILEYWKYEIDDLSITGIHQLVDEDTLILGVF